MMAAVRKTIRVLRCLLAASAAPLAIAPFAVAAAQEAQGAPVDIRISSGSLSSALMALGREAKVQIVFTPDSVEGRKSKGVRGRMTVDAALTRLLDGSGLSFRKVNGGSYVVSGPSKESYEKARRPPSHMRARTGYVGQEDDRR